MANGTPGSSPALLISAYRVAQYSDEHTAIEQVLVNCGECTCRVANESRTKFTNLSAVLLTSATAATLSGLPSLIFHLSDRGGSELSVAGPGIHSYVKAVQSFVRRDYPLVSVVECDGGIAPTDPPLWVHDSSRKLTPSHCGAAATSNGTARSSTAARPSNLQGESRDLYAAFRSRNPSSGMTICAVPYELPCRSFTTGAAASTAGSKRRRPQEEDPFAKKTAYRIVFEGPARQPRSGSSGSLNMRCDVVLIEARSMEECTACLSALHTSWGHDMASGVVTSMIHLGPESVACTLDYQSFWTRNCPAAAHLYVSLSGEEVSLFPSASALLDSIAAVEPQLIAGHMPSGHTSSAAIMPMDVDASTANVTVDAHSWNALRAHDCVDLAAASTSAPVGELLHSASIDPATSAPAFTLASAQSGGDAAAPYEKAVNASTSAAESDLGCIPGTGAGAGVRLPHVEELNSSPAVSLATVVSSTAATVAAAVHPSQAVVILAANRASASLLRESLRGPVASTSTAPASISGSELTSGGSSLATSAATGVVSMSCITSINSLCTASAATVPNVGLAPFMHQYHEAGYQPLNQPHDPSLPSLVFLGTGAAAPSKFRSCSGVLVSVPVSRTAVARAPDMLLLDCGEGCISKLLSVCRSTQRLSDTTTSMSTHHTQTANSRCPRQRSTSGSSCAHSVWHAFLLRIGFVWISHMHADHHTGLFSLMAARDEAQRCGCACACRDDLAAAGMSPSQNYSDNSSSSSGSSDCSSSAIGVLPDRRCPLCAPLVVVGPTALQHLTEVYSSLLVASRDSSRTVPLIVVFRGIRSDFRSAVAAASARNGNSSPHHRDVYASSHTTSNTIFSSVSERSEFPPPHAASADAAGVYAVRSLSCFASLSPVSVQHCHDAYGAVLMLDLPPHAGGGSLAIVYSGDTRPCLALVNETQRIVEEACAVQSMRRTGFPSSQFLPVVGGVMRGGSYFNPAPPPAHSMQVEVMHGGFSTCPAPPPAHTTAVLLIHEATMNDDRAADAVKKRHSTVGEALHIAGEMRARFGTVHGLNVVFAGSVLTHFSQRYPATCAVGNGTASTRSSVQQQQRGASSSSAKVERGSLSSSSQHQSANVMPVQTAANGHSDSRSSGSSSSHSGGVSVSIEGGTLPPSCIFAFDGLRIPLAHVQLRHVMREAQHIMPRIAAVALARGE